MSKASDDLPEPDNPVITVNESRGISTSIFLRLCSRAPFMIIVSFSNGCIKFEKLNSYIRYRPCDKQLYLTYPHSLYCCDIIKMSLTLQYRTISNINRYELKEQKSLFIAHIFPVKNEEEIDSNLLSLKKKYPDATHHCYAYKLLTGIIKITDDGEPSRTAGLRILNALDHHHITDVLLVVVRYYGGTKLGVGPLGKAYYDSALAAINPADIIIQVLHRKFFISFDFAHNKLIRKYFLGEKIKITRETYSSIVEYECLIPFTIEVQTINHLKELTKGKIHIIESEETEYTH